MSKLDGLNKPNNQSNQRFSSLDCFCSQLYPVLYRSTIQVILSNESNQTNISCQSIIPWTMNLLYVQYFLVKPFMKREQCIRICHFQDIIYSFRLSTFTRYNMALLSTKKKTKIWPKTPLLYDIIVLRTSLKTTSSNPLHVNSSNHPCMLLIT